MRGGPFSDPKVVEFLRPFIVTSWYGHRDSDMPDVVWKELSRRSRGSARESNVYYLILDPNGRLVHTFDAFPRGIRQERKTQYVLEGFQTALDKLGIRSKASPSAKLQLPQIQSKKTSPGIRIYVQLRDERMRAYQAPVVEVTRFGKIARATLEYPSKKREIEADILGAMFSHIYPPGIMERTNPDTKRVYDIEAIDGTLTLEPIRSSGNTRYAVLKGTIRLHDSGGDGFAYSGAVECLLGYDRKSPSFKFMRGTFDGIYPRQTRTHGTRKIQLVAAFETISR